MAKKKIPESNTVITDEVVKQAQEKLWYKGNLEWKLSATQKKLMTF